MPFEGVLPEVVNVVVTSHTVDEVVLQSFVMSARVKRSEPVTTFTAGHYHLAKQYRANFLLRQL